MFFEYGKAETDCLKSRDKKLGEIIERVGHVYRETDGDLFAAVVRHILGQQISAKAQQTLWGRLQEKLGVVNAQTLLDAGREVIQGCGTTWRKTGYILAFAQKVHDGEFDSAAVKAMSDADAIAALCALPGIGVWTAEMILLFCLQRPDILSFGDLAILRGMRMVYRHRSISRALFEKYRRRLSPCGSVASLYFWAVAGGAVPELKDPAPKRS